MMSKPKILVQLDTDSQASVFDGVVAVDAGVDHLFRQADVHGRQVRELVYGAIFTRGVDDLAHTAIFVGGSDVAAGEALLAQVQRTFFGPMRVSVMLDSNGANTTAAAAVLAAAKHVPLRRSQSRGAGGTGPCRVARGAAAGLKGRTCRSARAPGARQGSRLRAVAARTRSRELRRWKRALRDQVAAALPRRQVVIAAGAPGVELPRQRSARPAQSLKVAIDLSAVPPVGIAGIEVTDKAATTRRHHLLRRDRGRRH